MFNIFVLSRCTFQGLQRRRYSRKNRCSVISGTPCICYHLCAVQVHAYIIAALKKEMPSMFGKDSKKKELIKNLSAIYEAVQREHQISPGDFPDISRMQVRAHIRLLASTSRSPALRIISHMYWQLVQGRLRHIAPD